jgi:hypothetical protein
VVVYRSPLGRPSGNQPIPPRPPAQEKEKPELTWQERKAQEFLELNKTVDTAIERVRNQPDNLLSAKEKQLIIFEIEAMARQGARAGKKPDSGVLSKFGSAIKQVAGGVIAPFSVPLGSKARERAYDYTFGAAQRVVQSGIKEISDARANLGIDPAVNIFRRPSFTVLPPSAGGPQSTTELSDRITSKADPELLRQLKLYSGISGDPIKPSLKDFVSQTKDPDWFYRDTATSKAISAYSPAKGFFTDLGIDLVSEPASYITGVGNVKYVGRLGKFALAQRFNTAEMVAKYPALANKFNDIVRFGQHAPIEGFRDILKAEGIQGGVRFLGTPVRGTETIGEGVGRVLSTAWEQVMDIATSARFGDGVLALGSRRNLKDVGRISGTGINRGYRLTESEALGKIAHWSAAQYSKGRVPIEASRAFGDIRETVDAINANPVMAKNFYDLVETANPNTVAGRVRFDALPETDQKLVQSFVDWQAGLRTGLGDEQQALAAEYGLDIKDIGFIDNYLTHRMTGRAYEWLRTNGARAKRLGWDKSNLDLSDIKDPQQPLRHRKYRAPEVMPDGTVRTEVFFGEEVKLGTIKEMNEIFRRQTGTDIDFFETDIGIIANSYAYAMAKAKGRVSYTRRLLEYGSEVAQPLLKTMVPDPALRAATKAELDKALSIRADVRRAFGRRMTDLKSVINQGVKDAENIIAGNLKRRQLNSKETGAVVRRIEELEETLAALKVKSEKYAFDKRGDFELLHAELTLNIANLRAALEDGTAELNEIRLGLQTTYQTMYPNLKKIPTDIDVLADRISAARGVPAAREVRAINARLTEARRELAALSTQSDEYAELAEEIAMLKDLDNGYRVMAEYRSAQDYAPDNGFLYISAREMAETDEMQIGLKLLRTSAQGFPDQADVMGVRVFGNEEVIDFRTRSGVARTFGAFDFGDGLVDQLKLLQVDPEPLQTGLDAVRVGLPMDPELEQAFPEVADLVKLMDGNQAREIMPYGDPELVKVIYEEMVDATTGLLMKVGVENADYVARQVVDGAIGFVATKGIDTNSARGILLPASLFDDAAPADDIVVVLAPRVALRATDSVTGAVQDASSPLLGAVMRSGEEQAAGATKGKLNELLSRQEEIAEVQKVRQEISALTRRKGGLKSAATRRKNSAALAKERAGTAKNLPREIEINGKVENLTLAQIEKRLESLTATEARFRANMERTLVREQAGLRESGLTAAGAQAKLMSNVDRLKVLQNEVLALQTWDAGTGMVVRDEIAAAVDLIASMPPTGAAGEAAREWLARLQRTVNATTIISDPKVARNYKRLTELLAFDEWNLAIADEVAGAAKGKLDAIDAGLTGSVLAPREDLLLKGWEEIGGLGVQIPKEIMDVWKPNIDKVFNPADRTAFANGISYLNKIFKAYATGTIGFVVRNLYSAVYMNAVAGVDAVTMQKAWKAMHYYNKYGASKWLDELGITGLERTMYEQAVMAVESSGTRGMFTELATPTLRGTKGEAVLNAVLSNPYTRTIRGANSRVEQSVRFPLALKAIMDGDDYVTAASQINRYHFDYSDLSKVDEKFMQIVPFWIWTTRNLPNQMVNQFMRPQVYSLYESLKENLPTDDSVLSPTWMQRYEPLGFVRFGLDPKLIMRPDLPHKRLDQNIAQFTDIKKFAGGLYPLYKLPLEFAAGKSLGLDIPFKKESREAKGIDAALAETLGRIPIFEGAYPTVRLPDGTEQRQVSDFASYFVGNMVPIIATIQRITGGRFGGKESYADRQNSAIATFFGLPLDYVSDRMEGNEAISRQFGVREYLDMLKRLGYLEPAKVTEKRVQEPIKAAEKAAKEKAERDKNQAITAKSTEVLKAKEQFGTKSEEYKKLKQELDDLKNPKKRQKRIDEENIIARFGKDSIEHQRFLEELNLIKEKP